MKKRLYMLFSLLALTALILAACSPAATEEPAAEEPVAEEHTDEEHDMEEMEEGEMTDIGSEDHPIKVLFVPSVDTTVIVTGGEVLADALNEATGLFFEVSVPTSYAATIEEMCASTDDSMGFIPALLYALGNELCGVDVSFKAVRFGFPVYWAQFLVPRDSEYTSLEDLDGLTWGFGSATSTSGTLFPNVTMDNLGISPGESIETGGHNQAALAVYNGEVDFSTTFYSVPVDLDGNPVWTYEDWQNGDVTPDMYDIPDELVDSCAPDEDAGRIVCTDLMVTDARGNVRTDAPDIVQEVRILGVSDAVPNDTVAWGPDFPADLRAQLEEALLAFSETEAWFDSIGNPDFYDWTGISQATDSEFDVIRDLLVLTGQTLEDFR